MQEKVVFDTSIYIGIFNRSRFSNEINWFQKVTYLVHPVLHELWIGAKGKSEIRHLTRFGNTFVKRVFPASRCSSRFNPVAPSHG